MKINNIEQNYNQVIPITNKTINYTARIKNLVTKKDSVFDVFQKLVKIPSPPLKEARVAKWIMVFCKKNNIKAVFDSYKNIKITIPATDNSKLPLLFSAHMDVVGDSSPINLVQDGEFIKTDGKRTLGADNKAGVAVALCLAKEIVDNNLEQGGVEMLFTRDEELGMSGIMNTDFKNINAKNVLVLDEARLGQFDNAGAGFTTVTLSLTTKLGGHSGMDISDKNRLNAAKIISELIAEIPQGVYYDDGNGTITSLNVGTIIAGDIQNTATKVVEDNLVLDNYLDFFMKNSVTNVINTNAMATLSIRSSSYERENELRSLLIDIVEKFNKKYEGLITTKIGFDELIPIFEKTDDKTMENVYKEACNAIGVKPSIGTFPAGAETHIFANKRNKFNEKFMPILLGVADIFNMHSPSEKINVPSLEKGYKLVKEIFLRFTQLSR